MGIQAAEVPSPCSLQPCKVKPDQPLSQQTCMTSQTRWLSPAIHILVPLPHPELDLPQR